MRLRECCSILQDDRYWVCRFRNRRRRRLEWLDCGVDGVRVEEVRGRVEQLNLRDGLERSNKDERIRKGRRVEEGCQGGSAWLCVCDRMEACGVFWTRRISHSPEESRVSITIRVAFKELLTANNKDDTVLL